MSDDINYNDICKIITMKFKNEQYDLITIILEHFIENNNLTKENLYTLKGKNKVKWNGKFICSLQYFKSWDIWLKEYQEKYGSIVKYDEKRNICVLNQTWRNILDYYKISSIKSH